MCFIMFHIKVSFVSAHRHFLEPCHNQTIWKTINVNNCTISLGNNNTKMTLTKLISDNTVKIILIKFNVPANVISGSHKKPMELEETDTYVYQQYRWQIVRFDVGQNLLLFFLKFKLLNLTKINMGFKEMVIDVPSVSSSCETNLSFSHFGYKIREILLDYTRGYEERDKISVCTQVIKGRKGIADFRTICYTHKTKQKLSCDYLNPQDGWKNLMIFRDVIVVVILLFLPFLVPSRLYNLRHSIYIYRLEKKLPLTLTISKSVLSPADTSSFAFSHLKYPNLKNSCPYIETEYHRMVNALYLDIDEQDLLPRGYAGADFLRLIYKKVFRCKYNSKQMTTCLDSTLFPFYCRRFRRYTWYNCCSWFMRLFLFLLLPLPWCFRLFIYYTYEAKYISVRTEAAASLNLKLPFRGSILNYIPPLHWSFLFVYTLYFIDVLFFGVLYTKHVRSFGELVKEGFREMNALTSIEIYLFILDYLLWPLKTYGLPGLALVLFYWVIAVPLIVIWYVIDFIPIIRLILILLRHVCIYCAPCIFNYFTTYKVEPLPFKQRLSIFITTLIFLLSLVSASVLISECVCYIINLCFYGFIIIILKANNTLAYISLSFLVVFYFFETVKAVREEYDSFHKKVTDKLIEEIVDVNENIANVLPSQLTNIAYASGKSVIQLAKRRGQGFFCCSPSMILFIDSYHRPHIPERFFQTICNLPYAGCPGSLTISYLKSLRKYFMILIFLGFIFIVVQTFSGLYNFSTTNQMLATLVGGFIPLFIRKLISMNVPINEVDMETIAFKTHFKNAVREYAEDWIIHDFRLDLPENNQLNDDKLSCLNSSTNTDLFMNIQIRHETKTYRETTL